MAEVDIGAESYASFGDMEGADVYLDADSTLAAPWAELDKNAKGRNLVTATRILLRQPWREPPSIDAPPAAVVSATYEFAGAIAAGYDLSADPAASQTVRRQKAGSVEVEFFRDIDAPAYRPPPLPLPVWALIKSLIYAPAEGAGLPGSISSGTCGGSVTEGLAGRVDDRWIGFGSGRRDYSWP